MLDDVNARTKPETEGCGQMKIITATARTQGLRSNDYDWCVEGELVMPPVAICRRDRDNPDGECGCGRAWIGANSHRSTTTAVVRDLPLRVREYAEAIRSSLEYDEWWPDFVDNYGLVTMVSELLDTARSYPIGTVLERRLATVASR